MKLASASIACVNCAYLEVGSAVISRELDVVTGILLL